ncbi:tumor necrosis factor-inducible gene 6 protein isoform X2 [Tachyglossus aculeatus]|uniref:tumor necrosis factor-inducible gene 6 protein isoform X2 n=1 Tax=Tachyglossus aculeatus TaxID=9261 RepID=UPI0018F2974E|nr:tumor necrosis factor-inducible gene 6 protein isoform X2 [Tachyglossus aculeatus]
MIALIYFFVLLWDETWEWGFKDGIFHNSIWLEQAAGVYHREARTGKYKLTYTEAKAVCEFEGGHLATYQQLEAARKIAKECGGIFTDPKRIIKSPGFPNEYEDDQICYWHIRLKYGQRIHLSFQDFDLEDDTSCLADYLEIYDSYDDIHGFVGRYCGDALPEDIISTGNVMTLKFLSDASVTAGGFQLKYVAVDPVTKPSDGKNSSATSQGSKNFLPGKFGHL